MNPAVLGQHFLVNKNIAQKIVKQLMPVKGPVLEIGPGKGILTKLLISLDEKVDLVVVEKDKKLSDILHDELRRELKIINADILDIQLDSIFPHERINLIGNIPYLISKKIIDWIIREHKKIKKGVFMMQREFVGKLLPLNSSFKNTAQSITFGALFSSRKAFDVNPGSFSPPPKVVSTVFSFKKNQSLNQNFRVADFYNFVKRCFSNRRKTLLNNLSHHYGKKSMNQIFSNHNLNPSLRSPHMSVADFISLFHWVERGA